MTIVIESPGTQPGRGRHGTLPAVWPNEDGRRPGCGRCCGLLPDLSRLLRRKPSGCSCPGLGEHWGKVVGVLVSGCGAGCGGYIAQRIFSAKDERNGLLSVPGSTSRTTPCVPGLILTALAAIVLYPHLEHPKRIHAGGKPACFAALRGIVIADSWRHSCPLLRRLNWVRLTWCQISTVASSSARPARIITSWSGGYRSAGHRLGPGGGVAAVGR